MERKPAGYWTRERVFEIARQCTTKSEFWAHRDAYMAAQRNDWLKEMDWLSSKRNMRSERYEKNKAYREERRRKEMKGITIDMVDDFDFKVSAPAPSPDEGLDPWETKNNMREKGDVIASRYQKEIRKEWARRQNPQNIIIVEAGAINYKKGTMKYKCEIYQLRMTKEKQDEFKQVATSIIKENKEE